MGKQAPRVVGRYSIHAELGVGGMATVYLGRLVGAAGFSRVVAIKALHPHLARSSKFVEAFLDEARLAARIHHPNVVSTLDVQTDEEEILIVMEYVAGATLSELGRPPTAIACGIAWAMLNGLHAAHTTTDEHGHALGIVHRDVSPQNVLVGADGQTRVLDFGIAKADRSLHLTAPGEVKGKPAYMAPEQLVLECSSPRSDIYAAGVVLWELLTGRPMYDGAKESITLAKMAGEAMPPPSTIADVPKALDEILDRALRRNPDERYASAHDFAEALEHAAPIASARDIAAWVRREAAALMADRAAQVAAMESAPSVKTRPRTPRSTSVSTNATKVRALRPSSILPDETASESESAEPLVTIIPAPSPWRRWLPITAVVLLGGTGILWWRGVTSFAGDAPVSAAPRESGASNTAALPPPSSPSPPSLSSASGPVPLTPRSAPSPPIFVKATPRPAAVSRCARPFVIDDAGIKHLKPECL